MMLEGCSPITIPGLVDTENGWMDVRIFGINLFKFSVVTTVMYKHTLPVSIFVCIEVFKKKEKENTPPISLHYCLQVGCFQHKVISMLLLLLTKPYIWNSILKQTSGNYRL